MENPTTPEYSWRTEIATWTDEKREAWGWAANDYEDMGKPWMDAEQLAFEEIRNRDLKSEEPSSHVDVAREMATETATKKPAKAKKPKTMTLFGELG